MHHSNYRICRALDVEYAIYYLYIQSLVSYLTHVVQ